MIRIVPHGSALLLLTITAQAAEPSRVVLTPPIERIDHETNLVSLNAGAEQGLTLGDPVWLTDMNTLHAAGHLTQIAPTSSVAQIDRLPDDPSSLRLSVLARSRLERTRDDWPASTTLHGTLARLAPGRLTGWMNLGEASGLRIGDSFLVHRETKGKHIPIARAELQSFTSHAGLVTLEPLVSNAVPEPGDSVELFPEPFERALGSFNSVVMAVEKDGGALDVRIIGATHDGLELERLIDVWRDGQLVGTATIVSLDDPLSRARMIDAATATTPEIGDRVTARPTTGTPNQPLRAPVFKVEDNLCLLATGEVDGVRVDDRFSVYAAAQEDDAPRRRLAELTVYTVKVDYCGARIVRGDVDTDPIERWAMAVRDAPAWPSWETTGIVRETSGRTRHMIADIQPDSPLAPGDVVRWMPDSDLRRPYGLAIVIAVMHTEALLAVPPGWGNVKIAPRAAIQTRTTPTP